MRLGCGRHSGERGTESDHRIEFIMDSGEPQLLWTLRQRPRWLAKSNSPSRSYRTAADFLDATPSGFALQYLSDFPRLPMLSFTLMDFRWPL